MKVIYKDYFVPIYSEVGEWFLDKTGYESVDIDEDDYPWYIRIPYNVFVKFDYFVMHIINGYLDPFLKRFNRRTIKVSRYDMHSANIILADIVIPILHGMKESTKLAVPILHAIDDEDVPAEMASNGMESFHDGDIDLESARFNYILDEMLVAFTFYSKLWEWEDVYYEDKEKYKKEKKRVDNGLYLFGKYYQLLAW